MKKSIIALMAAASMSMSVNAQDVPGGDNAQGLGVAEYAAAWSVSLAVAAAIVSNNRKQGKTDDQIIVTPPSCNGDDPLENGFCVGTTTTVTNTVTVSGTQTITVPVTVPVTFTYAPQ